MAPRRALAAVLSLGVLAGCKVDCPIGGPLFVPKGIVLPPAAMLQPSMPHGPRDRRFEDALVAYAAAMHALPSHDGAELYLHIQRAIRLLADAVTLVPGSPAIRMPAYRAATDLRGTAGEMATTFAAQPGEQAAAARRTLEETAALLARVAVLDYAGSPDVLAAVRRFDATVRAVDPARIDPRAGSLVAALGAAEEALTAILRAAAPERAR